MRPLTSIFFNLFLLTGCMEVDTSNSEEAYKYWTGNTVSNDVKVLEGKYWQSSHWSKEYILYLKIKPSVEWWGEFEEENRLQVSQDEWTKPSDLPNWFRPSTKSVTYVNEGGFSDSRYFVDLDTGICYIYEIQL